IDVNVLRGTSGKEVKCNIGYKLIELHVKKATSLHLMCLICIVLMKTNREGGNCWASGEYCADEDEQGGRFDLLLPPLCHFPLCQQNSGFDLSGAEISGNFAGGGPAFYSLQK
uniref:Uncharacterized protein n=1 Tax=Oncorhynchus tshawytscha TaxID=74940 RepID=A0A8C8F6R7_ONCTS